MSYLLSHCLRRRSSGSKYPTVDNKTDLFKFKLDSIVTLLRVSITNEFNPKVALVIADTRAEIRRRTSSGLEQVIRYARSYSARLNGCIGRQ